jgi:hypothetical protein
MKATLGPLTHPVYLGLVVQDSTQKRIMDFNFSVAADQSQFAKFFVHENTDARSSPNDAKY